MVTFWRALTREKNTRMRKNIVIKEPEHSCQRAKNILTAHTSPYDIVKTQRESGWWVTLLHPFFLTSSLVVSSLRWSWHHCYWDKAVFFNKTNLHFVCIAPFISCIVAGLAKTQKSKKLKNTNLVSGLQVWFTQMNANKTMAYLFGRPKNKLKRARVVAV